MYIYIYHNRNPSRYLIPLHERNKLYPNNLYLQFLITKSRENNVPRRKSLVSSKQKTNKQKKKRKSTQRPATRKSSVVAFISSCFVCVHSLVLLFFFPLLSSPFFFSSFPRVKSIALNCFRRKLRRTEMK